MSSQDKVESPKGDYFELRVELGVLDRVRTLLSDEGAVIDTVRMVASRGCALLDVRVSSACCERLRALRGVRIRPIFVH